jgi:predicted negative regulator of RcsB-dependent stress response
LSASQKFGDVEMLFLLAALGVGGYIAYQIYQSYENAQNEISSANDTATSVLTNAFSSNDPIVAGVENAWTALTDPMGNSLVSGN